MKEISSNMKIGVMVLSMRSLSVLAVVGFATGGALADEPGRSIVPSKDVAGAPATMASTAPADGFWKVLVKAKARWVLKDAFKDDGGEREQVIVETYDVRKLGGADVARLRWTHVWGKGKKGRGNCDLCAGGQLTQVAVTAAGLYMLDASNTDAEVEAALKKKPSRSEPPKTYNGTKQNEGRYLRWDDRTGESLVCMGEGPLPGAGDCEDVCFGELCISAKNGPVEITGTWAPGYGSFVTDGYQH